MPQSFCESNEASHHLSPKALQKTWKWCIRDKHPTNSALPKFLFILQMWEPSLRWIQLSGGLFFCLYMELWWTGVASISQGCQLYGPVKGMCYTLSNWCSLWASQLCLETKFVINFRGHYSANYNNGTDLGFFYFFSALITTNLAMFFLLSGFNVVGHRLLACLYVPGILWWLRAVRCVYSIDTLIFTCATTGIVNCRK